MKSTASLTFFSAAAILSASYAAADPVVLSDRQYHPITYLGCFSSSTGLTFSKSLQYNTKGSCQTQCGNGGYSVEATTNKLDCWCGNSSPDNSTLVSDSNCNDPCAGYQQENCGAANSEYFSVYLSGYGTYNSDQQSSSSSSSSQSSTSSSSSSTMSTSVRPSSTASATPSVVTLSGQTVTVSSSNTASAAPVQSTPSSGGGGGPNKAGIAAGVVVGVVAVAAIIGGLYFYIRNRRRREVEEEYKRNAAVNNFIAGGKPPTSSGSHSFNDTRLDPVMAQRRMSDGSIADNQDYSRRILKVTNA